ncbi:hypothetical protein IQ07DRAFT_633775 [Pyrenochaeta sp. DS3sAY3a]|nr:hypothetical protein IQ07DRAFT_633775 [Pyrenochaeta sp. DS3sAY3a]
MAESLAILGLASNIISIVDFGLKLVSGARSVRDSLQGTTADVKVLELIVQDVRAFHDQNLPAGKKLSKHELRILAMATECENIAQDLSKAIVALRVRTGRSKTLESGRIAFQALWKQKDIEKLQSQLERLDIRIREHIYQVLKSENDSTVNTELKSIKASQKALQANLDTKMDLLKEEVLNAAKQAREKAAESQAAQLASFKTKVDLLMKEHSSCARKIEVLQSLYLQVLRKRRAQIHKADEESNGWIFDSKLTTFSVWLESEEPHDCFFYITGKAGSGKSTLMKYISEDPRTERSLRRWAGSAKLVTASFFFWNQGYEMQKNQHGLFQSLLYQILRSAPSLIPIVCPDRYAYEEWEIEELQAVIRKVAEQKELEVKFCFFIDGLDEYNGPEEDIVEVLKFLSMSNDIKICTSTRPRSVFDRHFTKETRSFDISNFTKEDMRRHVRCQLRENPNFQKLEQTDPSSGEIISLIADLAHGVWLWVFLVTRDLKMAVNRDEGVETLRRIVHMFPPDLESYFERMIKSVRPQYVEEMSQIFLIMGDELNPLPLYAFSLLEEDRKDPQYAIKAPIKPILEETLHESYSIWKSWIQNRCSDLLVVDTEPHPVFLSHSVDFLHRTVRDFLRDSYYDHLKANVRSDFNSTVALCKMCLSQLKLLNVVDFKDRKTIHQVIGLTDELLYYAYETERRSNSLDTPLVDVLDELDRVNSYHARNVRNHWTHARDSPSYIFGGQHKIFYNEGDSCNFLALSVQAGLVKYVRAKLKEDPRNMEKRGRPLLDYALRPLRQIPISMRYQSEREHLQIDVNMVKLLLENGADPNRPVQLNDGATVWQLFLSLMYGTPSADVILKGAWYQSCEMLIQYGAENCSLAKIVPKFTTEEALEYTFGRDKASELMRLMEEKAIERKRNRGKCIVM